MFFLDDDSPLKRVLLRSMYAVTGGTTNNLYSSLFHLPDSLGKRCYSSMHDGIGIDSPRVQRFHLQPQLLPV